VCVCVRVRVQTQEFFLFASLMMLSTVVFAIMAHQYQYVDRQSQMALPAAAANN